MFKNNLSELVKDKFYKMNQMIGENKWEINDWYES